MDPVIDQIQYPTGVMHCQSTESQPESMLNSLSEQGKPFNPEMTGFTGMDPIDHGLQNDSDATSYQGIAQEQLRTNQHGGIGILHCGKLTSFQVPLIFVLASASTFTSCHAYMSSLWGIQCHHKSAQHKLFLTLMGLPSMLTLMVDFGLCGSGPKDIWSECSCPTIETKKTTPLRGYVGIWLV